MKPARLQVQPANKTTGTLWILQALSSDWTFIGGKNSIYAPMLFSHCHSPFLLGPATTTATTTATARRDEQKP